MADPDPGPDPGPANEVPRVIVVTPAGGGISPGWHDTINSAVKDRSLVRVVKEARTAGSAVMNNFNSLLALALDCRDAGEVTHMAMVCGDVLAAPGWLDTLWAEMWYERAALVSAVVAVKGPTGRTSTAVGDEADRWRVKRCVNVRDREHMPPTFGPAAVCGPGEVLLVNDGLFLADLRAPWWDDFCWEFPTRIRKTPAGRVAEGRSEDWELSHHMHAAGARYVATWKVRVRHDGGFQYPNYPDPEIGWPPPVLAAAPVLKERN